MFSLSLSFLSEDRYQQEEKRGVWRREMREREGALLLVDQTKIE